MKREKNKMHCDPLFRDAAHPHKSIYIPLERTRTRTQLSGTASAGPLYQDRIDPLLSRFVITHTPVIIHRFMSSNHILVHDPRASRTLPPFYPDTISSLDRKASPYMTPFTSPKHPHKPPSSSSPSPSPPSSPPAPQSTHQYCSRHSFP